MKSVFLFPRASSIVVALVASTALTACGGGSTSTDIPTAEAADAGGSMAANAYRRARSAPTLALTTPTSGSTYSTTISALDLGGTVSDSVSVSSVSWTSDKGPSGTAVMTGTQPKMSWSIKGVPLSTNLNNITLTAKNSAGKATVLAVGVTLASAAPSPAPVPATTTGGKSTTTGGTTSTTGTPTTLITDQRNIGFPNVGARPAKGVVQVDPITGFKVSRISDADEITKAWNGSSSTYSYIVYARFTPSNVKGDMVVVHGSGSSSAVYRPDGTLLTVLRFKPSLGSNSRSLGEVNEVRWDYSGQFPYRLYFVGYSMTSAQSVQGENPAMSFYYTDINPVTGVQSAPVLIRDFSKDFPGFTGGSIMNDVEGDSSNDSRYWAWMVMNTTLGSGYKPYAVFTYDKQQNAIMGTLQRSCTGSLVTPCVAVNTPSEAAPYLTRPNMVEMSPLGTRVVVHWDRAYAGHYDADIGSVSDGPRAFLPNFTDPIRIATDSTHSGWAWGLNGEEMFVSQNNRNDYFEAVDIASAATAKCTAIPNNTNSWACGVKTYFYGDLSWNMGMHISKVYDRSKRGWYAMVTMGPDLSNWTFNQTLMIEINDTTVRKSRIVRLGSNHNFYYDYFSEGHGGLDFKAENLYVSGNWGVVNKTNAVADAYRVELPANWWAALPK
jgi:hypothetical protein